MKKKSSWEKADKMITIKDVKTLDGQVTTLTLPSSKEQTIDAKKKASSFSGVF